MPPLHPSKSSFGSDDIGAYFYELEQLLIQVESAATYYQIFGVGRSATAQEIKDAYARLMRLQPQSHRTILNVPDMASRIDLAFKRIAEAFATLSHFGKRIEYDNSLRRRTAGALPPPEITWSEARLAVEDILSEPPPAELVEPKRASRPAEPTILTNQATGDNRRRSPRLATSISVHVTGYDRSRRKWAEATTTIDASRLGIACHLHKRVVPGNVVHMLLPLPVPLRSHGCVEQGYTVYAIVRRVVTVGDGPRVVGFEFIGERPPADYPEQPWATYGTLWTDPNRRREKRHERFEMLEITYLDAGSQPVGAVTGYTENASRSGACVSVEPVGADLNLVRVRGVTVPFASRAFVRNRLPGGDGRERLCLQFIDAPFPL